MSDFPALAARQVIIELCANGSFNQDPACVGNTPLGWVNGQVNSTKSLYFVGDFIPYRQLYENLIAGNEYCFGMVWDVAQDGLPAVDYISTYDLTQSQADPTADTAFSLADPTDTVTIPADPVLGGLLASMPFTGTQQPGVLTMWGGSFDASSLVYSNDGLTDLVTKEPQSLEYCFTATGEVTVVAWGGHIASPSEWGTSNRPPGSPYHMANGTGNGQFSAPRVSETDLAEVDPGGVILHHNIGRQETMLQLGSALFADGFESGDTSAWTSTGGGGGLDVLGDAAFSGGFGLRVTPALTCSPDLVVDSPPTVSGEFEGCNSVTASGVQVVSPGATLRAGTLVALGEGFSVAPDADLTAAIDPSLLSPFSWVRDDSPGSVDTYNADWHLRLDDLSLDVGDEINHLVGASSDGTAHFRVVLRRNAALPEDRLAILAREDSGLLTEHSSEFLLPAGYNRIEIAWRAGAGTGELLVSINGALHSGLTGLNNGDSVIDSVHCGAVSGTLSSTTGTMDLDDFISFP